ncbi:MAG: hypothetical protein C0482_04940 [Gordonia sp.]|nr:hypothetical protein [Gordonia sp. (in: high G+C Gram-positive bacteria)]
MSLIVLFGIVLLVGACSEGGDGVSPANMFGGSKCERWEGRDNLTTEEIIASQDEWIATFADPNSDYAATLRSDANALVTGEWADWIADAPEGSHATYFQELCTASFELIKMDGTAGPGAEAVILNGGYQTCSLIAQNLNGFTKMTEDDFASDDWELAVAEGAEDLGGVSVERTRELLCPELPYNPAVDSSSATSSNQRDGFDSGTCAATLNGKPGEVEVTTGQLDCDEASDIITSSFEQSQKEQSKGVTVEKNGVTEWVCGLSGAGTSEAAGYDYKCDTPMGDIVIVWTAD